MRVDGSNLTSKQVIALAKRWGFTVENPTGLHNSGHTILRWTDGSRVQVRAPGRTTKEYTPRVVIAKLAAAVGVTRKEFLAGPQRSRPPAPPTADLPTAPTTQEIAMPNQNQKEPKFSGANITEGDGWSETTYPKAASAAVANAHGPGTQARRAGTSILRLMVEHDPLDYETIRQRLAVLYGEEQADKMMTGAVPRVIALLIKTGWVRRENHGKNGSALHRADSPAIDPLIEAVKPPLVENDLASELALAFAKVRTGGSVYMDGSHNPTRTEERAAADFVKYVIEPAISKATKNDLQQRAEKMAERVKTEGPKHKKETLPELLEPVGYALDGRLMLVDDKQRLWVAERKEV